MARVGPRVDIARIATLQSNRVAAMRAGRTPGLTASAIRQRTDIARIRTTPSRASRIVAAILTAMRGATAQTAIAHTATRRAANNIAGSTGSPASNRVMTPAGSSR